MLRYELCVFSFVCRRQRRPPSAPPHPGGCVWTFPSSPTPPWVWGCVCACVCVVVVWCVCGCVCCVVFVGGVVCVVWCGGLLRLPPGEAEPPLQRNTHSHYQTLS